MRKLTLPIADWPPRTTSDLSDGLGAEWSDTNPPHDYARPNWNKDGRVHEWKNYVSEWLKKYWFTFTDKQKAAIAENAQTIADREHWD